MKYEKETISDVLLDWAECMGLDGVEKDEFVFSGSQRIERALRHEDELQKEAWQRIGNRLKETLERDYQNQLRDEERRQSRMKVVK